MIYKNKFTIKKSELNTSNELLDVMDCFDEELNVDYDISGQNQTYILKYDDIITINNITNDNVVIDEDTINKHTTPPA